VLCQEVLSDCSAERKVLPFTEETVLADPGLARHGIDHEAEAASNVAREAKVSLQRAVFVIDRDDHIVYAEYVADQFGEPDYAAAIEAARQRSPKYGG